MKLPFIHIKNLSLSTSALWVLLERTLALFTRTFTMYFITLLLIQPVTWHGCTDTALRVSVSLQTAAHFCMDLWSSVIRSDFISQVPRITMAKRHCMVTHGMTVGGLMRAKTQTEWKKKSECVWWWEKEKGRCDRVKEEILLKVMNVSLSFLYDPGAFANYPDIQRSDPARLPTG